MLSTIWWQDVYQVWLAHGKPQRCTTGNRQCCLLRTLAADAAVSSCVCVCSSEDTQRSGLWLLPVYVNHSCLPNALTLFAPKRDMVNPGDLSREEPKVQRLIVLDCLFLRAGPGLGIQPVATA